MQHGEKEIEIARRYAQGEINDVQFNYLMVQNKVEKEKIEEILDRVCYIEPMVTAAKFALIYIMMCFFGSVVVSLVEYFRLMSSN